MSRTDWWWAVIDQRTGEQVAASYDEGVRLTSGKKARNAAEAAAKQWMEACRGE